MVDEESLQVEHTTGNFLGPGHQDCNWTKPKMYPPIQRAELGMLKVQLMLKCLNARYIHFIVKKLRCQLSSKTLEVQIFVVS